jgi:AmiR/NasT family two-component response regulator
MLMVSRNLTQDQAFDVLKKASQNSNQRLRDIARLMVEGDEADGSVTR